MKLKCLRGFHLFSFLSISQLFYSRNSEKSSHSINFSGRIFFFSRGSSSFFISSSRFFIQVWQIKKLLSSERGSVRFSFSHRVHDTLRLRRAFIVELVRSFQWNNCKGSKNYIVKYRCLGKDLGSPHRGRLCCGARPIQFTDQRQ